jgi:hypothetical protein
MSSADWKALMLQLPDATPGDGFRRHLWGRAVGCRSGQIATLSFGIAAIGNLLVCAASNNDGPEQ